MLYIIHIGDYSAYDEEPSYYTVVAKSEKEAKNLVYSQRKKEYIELHGPYAEFLDNIDQYDVTELTQTPGVKIITDYVYGIPGAKEIEKKAWLFWKEFPKVSVII